MRAGWLCRFAGGAVLILLGACGGEKVRDLDVPVKSPMATASVWKDRLYVRLTTGERLASVVAVDIAPLVPGMKLEQAALVAGSPIATRADDYGTYYQFKASANVELVHVTGPSSGGRLDKWVVWAEPTDDRVTKVFRRPLQELMTRVAPIREVIIHEQGRPAREAFSAHVDAGRVRDLEWYSIADAPEERAAEQGDEADER